MQTCIVTSLFAVAAACLCEQKSTPAIPGQTQQPLEASEAPVPAVPKEKVEEPTSIPCNASSLCSLCPFLHFSCSLPLSLSLSLFFHHYTYTQNALKGLELLSRLIGASSHEEQAHRINIFFDDPDSDPVAAIASVP